MFDDVVPPGVQQLAASMATPVPMRRGSVSQRSMKCGRKECRCQRDPQARHGPYYSLTRMEGGKTRSRYLSAGQAALARRQVEAGHQFRQKIEAYWEACEEWADVQLRGSQTVSSEGSKKGASKGPSKPRSSPKSKRS
jgi:hypothetical protein